MLHKTGDDWRLDDGAVSVEVSAGIHVPDLAAFGVAVDKNGDFPMSAEACYATSSLTTELSSTGCNAVGSAVQAHVDNCAVSKQTDASGTTNLKRVSINGQLTWSVSFRTRATGSRPAETKTETDNDFLLGTVDLAVNPPVHTSDS